MGSGLSIEWPKSIKSARRLYACPAVYLRLHSLSDHGKLMRIPASGSNRRTTNGMITLLMGWLRRGVRKSLFAHFYALGLLACTVTLVDILFFQGSLITTRMQACMPASICCMCICLRVYLLAACCVVRSCHLEYNPLACLTSTMCISPGYCCCDSFNKCLYQRSLITPRSRLMPMLSVVFVGLQFMFPGCRKKQGSSSIGG